MVTLKFKLALVSQKDYKKTVKEKIKQFVEDRWFQGIDTTLQDIQNVFQKPPYNLSDGTIRNYINELIQSRKLSTFYKHGRRYYTPPKIPISIKFGIAIAIIIFSIGVILDNLSPEIVSKFVYLYNPSNQTQPQYPSILPLIIYLISLDIIFTIFSYLIERSSRA